MINYTINNPFILVAITICLGIFVAFICKKTMHCTDGMVFSMLLLPALVCAALLAVNGSLGTSIAILGVFSLVRFRSFPGSAKDIVAVFFAMVVGVLMSTTYIFVGIAVTLLLGILIGIGAVLLLKEDETHNLKVLVPENLDFEGIFDETLKKYFVSSKLSKVRTSNMGTLFELTYSVIPKKDFQLKECLDEIRAQNGNLNVLYCKTELMEQL